MGHWLLGTRLHGTRLRAGSGALCPLVVGEMLTFGYTNALADACILVLAFGSTLHSSDARFNALKLLPHTPAFGLTPSSSFHAGFDAARLFLPTFILALGVEAALRPCFQQARFAYWDNNQSYDSQEDSVRELHD